MTTKQTIESSDLARIDRVLGAVTKDDRKEVQFCLSLMRNDMKAGRNPVNQTYFEELENMIQQ